MHSLHSQGRCKPFCNSQSHVPHTSHLPHTGSSKSGLIIADLQLNGVPELPQRSFYIIAFHCFVFQADQLMFFTMTAAGVQATSNSAGGSY